MGLPDWSELELNPGVLREPTPEAGRIIFWLPGKHENGYRAWERIGNVAAAEIIRERGLCRTPAISVPARQKMAGWLGRVLRRFCKTGPERCWVLPNGDLAEQTGERVGDRWLVWSEESTSTMDESKLRDLLGKVDSIGQVGKGLFLTGTIESHPEPAAPEQAQLTETPLEQARRFLTAAREAKDCAKQAMALTDLGVAYIREGDPARAIKVLERALVVATKLHDANLEGDARVNMGWALVNAGDLASARTVLDQELNRVTYSGQAYQEKAILAHLGKLHAKAKNCLQAIASYEAALGLARTLGDRRHEAELLWLLAIQCAESGDRSKAIECGQAAISVMNAVGDPHAATYAECLDRFRSDASDVDFGTFEFSTDQTTQLAASDSVIVSATAPPVTRRTMQKAKGPGLLNMAISAGRSAGAFLRSGFSRVSLATYQERLAVCADCCHHTGVRCRLCGCFTKLKASLPHERCPDAKW